jgi:regulatory protein
LVRLDRRGHSKSAPPGDSNDPDNARVAAIALLSRRDFCSGELQQKLQAQGFLPDTAAAAVAKLVAGGEVNDARYAEHYVAYHAERGQGPVRIAADLRGLGLSAEVIQAALAAGPDWRQRAREVRIRRFGLAEPQTWTQKAKQGRFLQYRGFSSDHIRAALGPDVDLNE